MATREPGPRVAGLLSYFTRHATAANLVMVLMIAAGFFAIPKMRAQFFPDVVINEVTVTVPWDDAGPDEVDSAIVQLLEPTLLVVEGVSAASSTATEGRARITLEFEPGWDMARAVGEVQAAVDTVRNLPEGADRPEVRRGAWRDRVTDVVIAGPVDPAQLGRLADELVARLFAEGITRTTIQGLAAPETLVEVSSLALIRNQVTMAEIAQAIAAEAETAPAGDISGANSRIRTGAPRRSAEEVGRIRLRANPDGSELTIADVASITASGVDRAAAYFVGDNPAMTIRVDRSDQGDAIGIQHQVERVAEAMRPTLPQGVGLDLIRTRAEAITARLNILVVNGLQGMALVVVLLFLFLNARTAFWVAAAIPVTMLATLAAMHLAGISINMVSLFALIITIGIIVDDAIVVGEHADFRARTLGEPPVNAAENAARRMFAPVFSSTATTVIAFLGLTFVGGRFGATVFDIPFTVAVILSVSLVECFLVLPNHMTHALAANLRRSWYDAPSRVVNRGFDWVVARAVRPLIGLVIRARYPVLAGAVLLLVVQAGYFLRGDLPWRFFSAPEQPSITGNFAMLPGATRADTRSQLAELQRATEVVGARYAAQYGRNPVDFTMAQIGGGAGRLLAGADTKDADQLGAISIELIDPDLRPYSSFQFLADLQQEVRTLPLTEVLSFRGWRHGPGGDAIDVRLYGADAPRLKAAAEALKARLATFPEVSALEDSLSYDKDELVLQLTPMGRALGFTIDSLGAELHDRLSGIEAAEYPDGPRTATIRVELPEAERTADFLDRIRLPAASGDFVALGDLVTVSRHSGFSVIRRENGLRTVSVTGDLDEDDPDRAAAIDATLRAEILPQIERDFGVSVEFGGLAEQEREFLSDVTLGFLAALIGIYAILAWVFGSWTRPAVVMAIIPFGIIGMVWGHLAWDLPLTMYSIVGLVGMTGIIINDSIVLVSTVDEYAVRRGLRPAIVDAVCDRLRPIFLTTSTTVVGLVPLLYESSQQAQFLKPTVVTLAYGLGAGTAILILVVPALLAMQLDIGQQMRAACRVFRLGRSGRAALPGLVFALGAVALFAATFGMQALGRPLPGPLAALAPGGGPFAAFGLFALGCAALALGLWLVSVLALGLTRLRRA